MIIGINNENNQEKYEFIVKTINDLHVIEINMKSINKLISVVPLYLRKLNWHNDFEKLKGLLEKGLSISTPVLIGDVNVRVGHLQGNIDENIVRGSMLQSNRNSKDETVNTFGRKYVELLSIYGLVTVNGRCVGDLQGELTFTSTVGRSVNDILAMGSDIEKYRLELRNSS